MINLNAIVLPDLSLLDALKKMDKEERKLLIICDSDLYYIGVISVGDIQRAIIDKKSLDLPVSDFVRSDMIYATDKDDISRVKKLMLDERIESMPIVGQDNRLVDMLEWNDLFSDHQVQADSKINSEVVIMAGGKGTRLKPLTNIIPKPLIPISEKTIVECVMDQFTPFGCSSFYLSVNYKADMIRQYFSKEKQNRDTEYKIKFVEEKEPLGTAGSLQLLQKNLSDTFIVTNCDILVDVDLYDLMEYHKKNHNVITIVSALKNFYIPYGTIETKANGELVGVNEKPTLTFQINSGLYVVEQEAIEYIEENERIDFPELIQKLMKDNKKVGVFPVSEGSWHDMGNWDAYLKIIKNM